MLRPPDGEAACPPRPLLLLLGQQGRARHSGARLAVRAEPSLSPMRT